MIANFLCWFLSSLLPMWILPFSVPNLFPLKDDLARHQAEQSYISAPVMSSIFFRCSFSTPSSALFPSSTSLPPLVVFFVVFVNNSLPSLVFFFLLLEQLGAQKGFFGFDLSINRKSLKCPFFKIVLIAFGLPLTRPRLSLGFSYVAGAAD